MGHLGLSGRSKEKRVNTLSTAPVRYVPLGRPCVSCDYWRWKGGVFVMTDQENKLVIQSCYCQKNHKPLDVGNVLNGVIPKWCPNVLHVMIASGEQN